MGALVLVERVGEDFGATEVGGSVGVIVMVGVMVGIGGAFGALVTFGDGAQETPLAQGTKKTVVSLYPKSPAPLAKTS